jgi:hypothetical protein
VIRTLATSIVRTHADLLSPQCRGRKPGADKVCQDVEREAVRHHELVSAPSLTGSGEDRECAALFRAEALRHQVIAMPPCGASYGILPDRELTYHRRS